MGLLGKTVLIGTYLSGINIYQEEELIQATIEGNEIIFKAVKNKKKTARLDINKINNIEVYKKEELMKKDKSVVGRAVVGTLVAGPLGTIVGGMSGIGKKNKKKKFRIMVITYENDKQIILLEGKWAANFDRFTKQVNKLIKNKDKEIIL